MEEIIMQYVAMWAPAVAAVLAIVSSALLTISKIKTAINSLKQEDTINNLTSKLSEALRENKEIKEELDVLIDKITKIEHYRENLK